jgi:transcriptional repressor NrdR
VSIRRRRECLGCENRFTTYEALERTEIRVIKRDGRHEILDRQKLLNSIAKACEKRPIGLEQMERSVEDILQELESFDTREISSKRLGALVMVQLHTLDQVAYVRYASVYREFQEIGDFLEEIESLEKRIARSPAQRELFKP